MILLTIMVVCFIFDCHDKCKSYVMISVRPVGQPVTVRHGKNFHIAIMLDTINVINVQQLWSFVSFLTLMKNVSLM